MSDPLKFTDLFSPEIISVNGAISLIKTAIQEVYERVKMLEENEELRKCIERQAKWLGQTADELEKSKIENFPQSCSDCLQDFKDSISECSRVCAELKVAKNKAIQMLSINIPLPQLTFYDNLYFTCDLICQCPCLTEYHTDHFCCMFRDQ